MSAAVDTTTGEDVSVQTADVGLILVSERHRQDLGDIDGLAASIADVGLINPISVTWDMDLIAGERRLAAVRQLGWETIDVRVLRGVDDAADDLRAERDENTCRKAMTASELHALGKALEEMERPKAAERQASTHLVGRDETGAPLRSVSGDTDRSSTRSREVVGPAVGLSAAQWGRLKHVGDRAAEGDQKAVEILADIDAGKLTISGGYQKLRASTQPSPDQPSDPSAKAEEDTRSWVPFDERAAQVRDLASTGHVARQIATQLGIGIQQIRSIAKRADIVLPDKAIGKTHRIDPHRVVSETVIATQASASVVTSLLDLDGLTVDPEEAHEWATSLSQSLRTLTSLRNRLKKVAHEQA